MKFQKITIDFGGLLGYIVRNEWNEYEGWIDGYEVTIYTHHSVEQLIAELEETAWFYLNKDSFTE